MPPKKRQSQSTLNLHKTRRNTIQQQQQQHHKSIDDNVIQIGKQKQHKQPETNAQVETKKLEIHQEHLNETDKLLRAFDLNYDFGPCVGMKRLDRWERAQKLGLNPPVNVREILIKDKAQTYAESVFHQFRMI
ncbi:DNA polymerase delta, subunit 4 [Parasitella parasitica]|nr:DNA polymerase delta, subunit 4 [Parasitella parasitica]